MSIIPELNLNNRGPRARAGTGLYAQVVDALGQAIVEGTLNTGQVVYTDQLCKQLGVSRSVVREGLRALSSMGLIEARPQMGTSVLSSAHWDLLNPRIVTWRAQSSQHVQQMRELQEFRLGVEPTAAWFAATRVSSDAAAALLRSSEGMKIAMDNGDLHRFFASDAEFHRLLLHSSGNPIIAQCSDTIEASLYSRSNDVKPASEVLNRLSLQRHIDLAHAIADRDPETAKHLAHLIIEETLREFNDFESGA